MCRRSPRRDRPVRAARRRPRAARHPQRSAGSGWRPRPGSSGASAAPAGRAIGRHGPAAARSSAPRRTPASPGGSPPPLRRPSRRSRRTARCAACPLRATRTRAVETVPLVHPQQRLDAAPHPHLIDGDLQPVKHRGHTDGDLLGSRDVDPRLVDVCSRGLGRHGPEATPQRIRLPNSVGTHCVRTQRLPVPVRTLGAQLLQFG